MEASAHLAFWTISSTLFEIVAKTWSALSQTISKEWGQIKLSELILCWWGWDIKCITILYLCCDKSWLIVLKKTYHVGQDLLLCVLLLGLRYGSKKNGKSSIFIEDIHGPIWWLQTYYLLFLKKASYLHRQIITPLTINHGPPCFSQLCHFDKEAMSLKLQGQFKTAKWSI